MNPINIGVLKGMTIEGISKNTPIDTNGDLYDLIGSPITLSEDVRNVPDKSKDGWMSPSLGHSID